MIQHIVKVVLTLSLGAAVYAQQRPVKMTFSGTAVATSINLRDGTVTDEDHFVGNGALGSFIFRQLRADGPAPQQSPSCAGRYFLVVTGAGVFSFQDGSQMNVGITEGNGCINLEAGFTLLTVTYQITGGTGRFVGAAGALTLKGVFTPVHRNAANAPALLTLNGDFEGTVSGAAPMSVPQIVTTASGPAVLHADFSPVTAARPGRAGEVLIMQVTGLGPTATGIDPGRPFPTDSRFQVNSAVNVTVNGRPAEVINSIGWPGLVDTYRIDFRVPDGTTAGLASIQLAAAWIAGPDVRIAIQ